MDFTKLGGKVPGAIGLVAGNSENKKVDNGKEKNV